MKKASSFCLSFSCLCALNLPPAFEIWLRRKVYVFFLRVPRWNSWKKFDLWVLISSWLCCLFPFVLHSIDKDLIFYRLIWIVFRFFFWENLANGIWKGGISMHYCKKCMHLQFHLAFLFASVQSPGSQDVLELNLLYI